MNKLISHIYILFLIIFCLSCAEPNPEKNKLYEAFIEPPASAKPFVRWWWNGNCVEEQEIEREIDVMHQAGIGGFEINPIAMPKVLDTTKVKTTCHDWLSKDWIMLVKQAVLYGKQKEMLVDIIVGSGWPFGGEFIPPENRIKALTINRVEVEGSGQQTININKLLKSAPKEEGRGVSQLFFLKLVPYQCKGLIDVKDLKNDIDESGFLDISIPDGKYHLVIGAYSEDYREVSLGASGSSGPVLDHYDSEALNEYLIRMEHAIESILKGEMGDYFRAVFCDSIELSGANWSEGFSDYFYKKNGYNILPWLPFVITEEYHPSFGYKDELPYSSTFLDSVKRSRYDYNYTLAEYFINQFTKTFHNWAHDNKLKSRYQAYGTPWFMGIAEAYMIPDIPEANNWLYTWRNDPKQHGFWIWNKYASSAAHILGKKTISCEAMTNTRAPFRVTLEEIKQADDFNFITGINHSILHGMNYSPLEEGLPGRVRFGTYFSEQNTWWTWFDKWTTYNSRLSSIFQLADPEAEVAILAPFADHYMHSGLSREPIQLTPWYVHDLWESCSRLGYNTDYISETALKMASSSEGHLKIGEMEYKVLIIADAKNLLPETMETLHRLALNGTKIIFIDQVPDRSPTLKNAIQSDSIVRHLAQEMLDKENVVWVQSPKSYDEGMDNLLPPVRPFTEMLKDLPPKEQDLGLLKWTKNLFEKEQIQSPIVIENPDLDVYQIHYKYKGKNIFFFSNQSKQSKIVNVRFEQPSNLVPWLWNPETGSKIKVKFEKKSDTTVLHLSPLESKLIVFDTDKNTKDLESGLEMEFVEELNSNWDITFSPVEGDTFSIKNSPFIPFHRSGSPKLTSFSGIASYKTKITLSGSHDYSVDLGNINSGITELYLNGHFIGTEWYGQHMYTIDREFIDDGENKMEIKYVTTLDNYLKRYKNHPAMKRWVNTIDSLKPEGIEGPLKLYQLEL